MKLFKPLIISSIVLNLSCSSAQETTPNTEKVTAVALKKSENNEPISVANYELVWSDEFNGESLDSEKWSSETGANGWGNNEWQNYTNGKNISLADGTLKITAKKTGPGQKRGDYTSGRLSSIPTFTYGRFEIRAKLPEHRGKGLWPAIWMLGESLRNKTLGWPDCGEIDIMEYVSYEPDVVHFNLHTKTNNHSIGTNISSGPVKLETAEEEFHNYGVIWNEQKIQLYLDDVSNVQLTLERPQEFNQQNWPFDQPFFFVLNVAVGGNWGGSQGVDDSIFPATMEIDYVRVYQARAKNAPD